MSWKPWDAPSKNHVFTFSLFSEWKINLENIEKYNIFLCWLQSNEFHVHKICIKLLDVNFRSFYELCEYLFRFLFKICWIKYVLHIEKKNVYCFKGAFQRFLIHERTFDAVILAHYFRIHFHERHHSTFESEIDVNCLNISSEAVFVFNINLTKKLLKVSFFCCRNPINFKCSITRYWPVSVENVRNTPCVLAIRQTNLPYFIAKLD